jgi:hypothetical protein
MRITGNRRNTLGQTISNAHTEISYLLSPALGKSSKGTLTEKGFSQLQRRSTVILKGDRLFAMSQELQALKLFRLCRYLFTNLILMVTC